MKEPKTDFGSWIRTERKKLGLSQKELADMCGVSCMTIRRYESGIRKEDKSVKNSVTKIRNCLKGDSSMEEMRGYPNPNYTEQDVLPCVQEETKAEIILDDQLIEIIQKAALFDCLANAVRLTGEVDVDLVRAITRNLTQEEMVPKKDADSYWNCYMRAQDKATELEEKVARLEHARSELIEILRQNKIGPFADPEPGSTLAKLIEIQKEAKEANKNE